MVAYIGLIDLHPAALVQLAENAPANILVLLQTARQTHYALLYGVDPDLASHGGQDFRLEVRGRELRVGLEGELLDWAGGGCTGSIELIEEGGGEDAQDFHGTGGVAVFALLAMLLEAGVAEESVEPGLFSLLLDLSEGLIVELDEAGDIAVSGFYDLFR